MRRCLSMRVERQVVSEEVVRLVGRLVALGQLMHGCLCERLGGRSKADSASKKTGRKSRGPSDAFYGPQRIHAAIWQC